VLIDRIERGRPTVIAIVLIGIAAIRIASTYTIFSATYDEPTHVSAGLELLTQHRYTLQYENPPLPRLIFAAFARLGGMTFDPHIGPDLQIREVLYANGKYKTNLVMARVANLVFFVVAALAVWWWARRELGPAGGALAVLIFTMQPVILGYSGLATHDTAAVAGLAVAVVAFLRWLDRPTPVRAIVFGLAYGVAILCKLSAIGYVPAACLAIYALRVIRDEDTRRAWRRIAPSIIVAAATCAFLIWAGYAFTVGRLHDLEPYRDVLDHHAAAGRFVASHPQWRLPAPAFFLGLGALLRLNENPWSSYLFGEVRTDGWWYYFPVALALKTTLASLILAIAAAFARRTRVAGEALAAAGAILLVAMPSRLDIGVRFVLPMYAPLSVAAAAGALSMLRSDRRWLRVAAIVLLAWHCGASFVAHPDEFPYFNELAGREPSRYLQDSNVDWGQDVLRLRRVVREKGIDRIGLAILGVHDYDKLGFPPHYEAERDVPSDGWVAASDTSLSIFGGYNWLRGRHYERVGKSIRLYFVK
jgi:hypothetical protein